MDNAVIVATARTPIGRAGRGAFNNLDGPELGAIVINEGVRRAGIEGGDVEDVLLGAARLEGPQGNNVARLAALRAGLPVGVPGVSLDRKCASGLQTIAFAAQRIMTGEGDIYVAGGANSGGNGWVSVINPATNTVIATIPVGPQPGGVAVNPTGPNAGDIDVANIGSDTVSVINPATNTVIATIAVGSQPSSVAVNPIGPDAGDIYVTNSQDDTVSVIS